jgi:hypothetical protein
MNSLIQKLQTVRYILRVIAYPKRGTSEEHLGISDVAKMIQDLFSLSELEG